MLHAMFIAARGGWDASISFYRWGKVILIFLPLGERLSCIGRRALDSRGTRE
jgi:hypothetical protein